MTDEAKALVDAVDRYVRVCTTGSSDGAKYRARKNLMDLIETQAREIERLRGALEVIRDGDYPYKQASQYARAALAGDSHDQ